MIVKRAFLVSALRNYSDAMRCDASAIEAQVFRVAHNFIALADKARVIADAIEQGEDIELETGADNG
jgi:hypothetical protein